MSYLNVGANIDGQKAQTKKALREALRVTPEAVQFYTTSGFDGSFTFSGKDIPAGKTLSVVGPDPYTKRSWYASVITRPNGRVIVS